jgi:choline dehydrogenase
MPTTNAQNNEPAVFPPGQEEFDYIIVGAGASGCVIANRLSEDKDVSILLLEAGGPGPGPEMDPARMMGSEFDWKYQTEREPQLANRRIAWPRGRVLGGSTTISSMFYHRGNRLDYDHWNYLGNEDWSYLDVLPYFKKSETNAQFNDEFHGPDGPLRVELISDDSLLKQAFLAACEKSGFKSDPNWDFNGAQQDGVAGVYQKTSRDGKPESVADAFLAPFLDRPNLKPRTFCLATKLLWDRSRVVGVEYRSVDGSLHTARARREVIVSAGTVDSPRLLMLSGIGPAQYLRSHGIAVKEDLAGTGQNLQDHLNPHLIFVPNANAGDIKDRIGASGFFLRTRPGLQSAAPDLKVDTVEVVIPPEGARFGLKPGPLYYCTVCLARPQSVGSVSLNSADPMAAPVIRANYLESQRDLDVLVDGIELMRLLAHTSPLKEMLDSELKPGLECDTRDQIVEFIRQNSDTGFHPTGTCKMGHDPMAVVDDKLRVHGVQGLRVADASIMPTVINANTIAPSVMIGEKAADLIKNS